LKVSEGSVSPDPHDHGVLVDHLRGAEDHSLLAEKQDTD